MKIHLDTDIGSARIVAASAQLTMVPVEVTLRAHLRAAHLPRLNAAGPLGRLLTRQGLAHAEDNDMSELARTHRGLPDDLLNFQYDGLACAVALGWSGAILGEVRLAPVLDGDVLRFEADERGRPTRVLLDLDTADFTERWLAAVEAAGLD